MYLYLFHSNTFWMYIYISRKLNIPEINSISAIYILLCDINSSISLVTCQSSAHHRQMHYQQMCRTQRHHPPQRHHPQTVNVQNISSRY